MSLYATGRSTPASASGCSRPPVQNEVDPAVVLEALGAA